MNIFANQLSTMFFLRGIHIGYLRGKLKYKKKIKGNLCSTVEGNAYLARLFGLFKALIKLFV